MKTTFSYAPVPPPPVRCVVELEPEDIKEILTAYGKENVPVSFTLRDLIGRIRSQCQ